jgi:hypothetical protein
MRMSEGEKEGSCSKWDEVCNKIFGSASSVPVSSSIHLHSALSSGSVSNVEAQSVLQCPGYTEESSLPCELLV